MSQRCKGSGLVLPVDEQGRTDGRIRCPHCHRRQSYYPQAWRHGVPYGKLRRHNEHGSSTEIAAITDDEISLPNGVGESC